MKERLFHARRVIADAFGKGDPVFLSFSGGKESLVLLKLFEPYEGRFKLIWANTGHNFPHVEAMIRAKGERFGLVELNPDLAANWRVNGWPSELLTVASVVSRNSPIRLQPWAMCCYSMKALPMSQFFAALDGPSTYIHGQRNGDGYRIARHEIQDQVTSIAPLFDWSTEDVFAFTEAEGIELPEHYAEIKDSLDCWICPAHWSEPHAPAYARYVKRRYPETAKAVLVAARETHARMSAVVDNMREALDEMADL